jgi:glycine/serine hydroxymethyltransferase
MADISHTAGHVFTGNLSNSPLQHADIITFTTHKMGGPKGAVILTRKGIKYQKTGEDKARNLVALTHSGLFPGVQGGPDSTHYLGVKELFDTMLDDVMVGWAERVTTSIQNVQNRLRARLANLVADSDTHLILWNVSESDQLVDPSAKKGAGKKLAEAAEQAGLILNAYGFKGDRNKSLEPGGVRIGMNGPARRVNWSESDDVWLANSLADMAEVLHDDAALAAVVQRVRGELDEIIGRSPIRWDIPRQQAA